MQDNEVEVLLRLAHGAAYRAFGFGVDSLDFARVLLRLSVNRPDEYQRLHRVAGRLVFIDYLRYEAGWRISIDSSDYSMFMRLGYNIDALEIYLLCTCIDTLAKGLGSSFVNFFQDSLPPTMKLHIADSFVVLEGDVFPALVPEDQDKWHRWQEMTVDQKLKKIARDYLYERRRNIYTHEAAIEQSGSVGVVRRVAFGDHRQALPGSGWNRTNLFSAKDPDKVRLTVFTRSSIEEGFVLRSAIALVVLTRVLHYDPPTDYHEQFQKYYEALSAVYAALHEHRANLDYLNLLSLLKFVGDKDQFQIRTLRTAATARLVEHYGDYVALALTDLRQYMHSIEQLNRIMLEFANENDLANITRDDRISALDQLGGMVSTSPYAGTARWLHQTLLSNLRRFAETGQIGFRMQGLVPSQFSNRD